MYLELSNGRKIDVLCMERKPEKATSIFHRINIGGEDVPVYASEKGQRAYFAKDGKWYSVSILDMLLTGASEGSDAQICE